MGRFDGAGQILEDKIMPIANKMGKQRHLAAIRDAFISLLPINLMGGIAAILKSPPVTDATTNGFLLAWKGFAESNDVVLNWLYAFTLGAMSLYICMGITHFLCKHHKINNFIPLLLSVLGFMLLVCVPIEMSWAAKSLDFNYIDGKGLIPAMFVSILTVELYHIMKKKNFGKIAMPPSVPASLSDTFASMVPCLTLIVIYILIFSLFNAFAISLPGFLFSILSPVFSAADSMASVIIITVLVHIFWFFGIHDAALSGVLGPLREMNLSINASAQMAGEPLSAVFTTPFWVYFVIIGGCGSVLSLAILLLRAKSKQLKTVGRIGIIPAFFCISEPITFGVPLMLNPMFFIPFILTSVVNGVISYLTMSSGLIAKTFAIFSWNMPSIFGSFFSTMDWKAPILILILIVIDMLIYYPFAKVYDRQLYALEQEDVSPEEAE